MYLKGAPVQLCAGAILVDGSKAPIINCIEIYSRLPTLDGHIEKEGSNNISSIPSLSLQYEDVSIINVYEDKSDKLLIGTTISNMLVTSSLRIDKFSYPPKLGPSTNHFRASQNTKIYLSMNSIRKCNAIIEAKENILELKHEIYNLKQICSNSHRSSTYTFSRGFSRFTHNISNTPLTIFTAADSQYIQNYDTKIASSILKEIAWAALTGSKLKHDDFLKLISGKSGTNKEVSQCINFIKLLFTFKSDSEIIGNEDLNIPLEILARYVTNNLTQANQSVAKNVLSIFRP